MHTINKINNVLSVDPNVICYVFMHQAEKLLEGAELNQMERFSQNYNNN